MIYTIVPGDTLTSIATQLTLDPSYYKAIAAYNGIADPNTIYAGAQITIPDNWLKGANSTTANASTVIDTSSDSSVFDTTGAGLSYPSRPGANAPDAQAYIQQYAASQPGGGGLLSTLKTTSIAGIPLIYIVYGVGAWFLYKTLFKRR